MAAGGGFFSAKIGVLGLPIYTLIAFSVGVILLVSVLLVLICLLRRSTCRRRRASGVIPLSTKEIAEITQASPPIVSVAGATVSDEPKVKDEEEKKKKKHMEGSSTAGSSSSSEAAEKKIENIGWGRWYSLAELEAATGGFSPRNVIGEGGYGIVYRGVLPDFSIVAVKNLLNNKGQAEKEFKVEVEAIGKVRHKNLVGLLGYCAEGAKRMVVYEYIDNGNLEQWLHGDVGPVSPLTWDIRMKIAIETAKGIAYLHEGLEPKVVHRDIKSSNILLDKHWNPKVSDFGMAKLLGSGSSFVTTRVMGTFGYVAPEYACTGMLNESHDVYSFGVLLMEIVSGRSPVDYSRSSGEVNLVEWFKKMVGSRREDDILDPLIPSPPSPRALKRVLLVCLRCVDLDSQKRPKMGQIVHMLEGDEFPFRVERRSAREMIVNIPVAATNSRIIPSNSERSMWR